MHAPDVDPAHQLNPAQQLCCALPHTQQHKSWSSWQLQRAQASIVACGRVSAPHVADVQLRDSVLPPVELQLKQRPCIHWDAWGTAPTPTPPSAPPSTPICPTCLPRLLHHFPDACLENCGMQLGRLGVLQATRGRLDC